MPSLGENGFAALRKTPRVAHSAASLSVQASRSGVDAEPLAEVWLVTAPRSPRTAPVAAAKNSSSICRDALVRHVAATFSSKSARPRITTARFAATNASAKCGPLRRGSIEPMCAERHAHAKHAASISSRHARTLATAAARADRKPIAAALRIMNAYSSNQSISVTQANSVTDGNCPAGGTIGTPDRQFKADQLSIRIDNSKKPRLLIRLNN
jgi:hypothetical protein